MTREKIVLAYSGGLDTSVILKWLQEEYDYDVVAVAVDVGQGEDELRGLEEKALRTGAVEARIVDAKEEFVNDYLFPMIKSGAVYEGKYMLGTSIARPLIAKKLVEVAVETGAVALSHGATGKGNDQVRFELTFKALQPGLKIIAPWREWDIRSRSDAMEYARCRDIPVPVTADKLYSMDRNLWHFSYEGGILEDPMNEPREDMFILTNSPQNAPEEGVVVDIQWEKGIPVALDGVRENPVILIEKLNTLAGRHGVGRSDIVENRLVGMKSRGIYETPAGTVLSYAHRELEHLTLDRDTLHYQEEVSLKYAEMLYDGLWFTPLRQALDAFFNSIQSQVTGRVILKLYRGNIIVLGRESDYSLYDSGLATFEDDDVYDQKDAQGFINLFGLPIATMGQLQHNLRKRESVVS